jgi:hypothetical protein
MPGTLRSRNATGTHAKFRSTRRIQEIKVFLLLFLQKKKKSS